ncbi:hypothetical protein UFOVP75_147 [uncultured Caudovirales phage]|uniref:Uncharacterized protein n=1 Tax=uncultured Caudovirales phage TaxID=2100421 RepID=A0A6J5L637_9CAUD|nr:hypothetical protein UFOVP75_147 [uncultured Caudovirales phage]
MANSALENTAKKMAIAAAAEQSILNAISGLRAEKGRLQGKINELDREIDDLVEVHQQAQRVADVATEDLIRTATISF